MPLVKRAPKRKSRLPKREESRRLVGLGLNHHDDPDIKAEALRIVERFLTKLRTRASDVSGQRTGYRFPLSGGNEWIVKVEAVHVRTRGAFCPDFLNCVSLTDYEHRRMPGCQQSNSEFFEDRGIDLDELLWRVTVDYLSEALTDCKWIAANSGDGALAKLAADILDGKVRRVGPGSGRGEKDDGALRRSGVESPAEERTSPTSDPSPLT